MVHAEGDTFFRADTPTPQAEKPAVVQGAIEGSNVSAVMEITRMMTDLRDYQFTAQLVQAEDDRLRSTIDKTLGRNG